MTTLQPADAEVETLDLTIRFSASLADLLLSLPQSKHATTATLKLAIRARLPDEYARRRIRLIHAGKALADEAALASTLKRPSTSTSHTPSRTATPVPADAEHGGKGKAAVRDPPLRSRIYIHCSIGDVVLSSAELAAEAALAQPNTSPAGQQHHQAPPEPPPEAAAPAPRGFDRLLASGFTPAEVQTLRLQFLAVQAHTHTPETMPAAAELRDLEDAWLDSGDNTASALTSGVGGDDEGAAGHLDDMIWGATMGFFWPVGCLLWAFREEGIWSRRRKMAVVIGVLINMGFGTMRWMR